MPVPYKPDAPDEQSVHLVFPDSGGVVFDRWTSYEFSSDFITPTDSFHFAFGVDEGGLPEKQKNALRFGARIDLKLGDLILATGRVDRLEIGTDRSQGSSYSVGGRDLLGQTLDTIADPTVQFKTGTTLAEFLKQLFEPFGFTIDAEAGAGRDIKSTKYRGNPQRKNQATGGGGKRRRKKKSRGKGKALTAFQLHQTKPYNHESIFHFGSRVAQRQGQWIWLSTDGTQLIVGTPDFDQEPTFELRRTADGSGNILSGSVTYDMADQPSMIVADGFSGGGEFGKGKIKSYCVSPVLGYTDDGEEIPEVAVVLAKHPGASKVVIPHASFLLRAKGIPFRPMFLHDDESKTQEQLDNFIKREMSLMNRKAMTASYTVEGHGQVIDDAFVAWEVDTMVHVVDDAADLDEDLYVLGVHFQKSRSGGTTTRLQLVRKNSITF
jgi:prophage tail gpP-like protein